MSLGLIKRSVVALFIVCGVLLMASHSQTTGAATIENMMVLQQPNASDGQKQQLAEEHFKNIQIFKGQPAQNVMRAMMFFTKSLGVDCSFCHVHGAMDKDDKEEKKFARTMYQIVQFANQSIGEPRVSCYTCHRGHKEPEMPPDLSKAQVEEMFKKADEDKRPAETVYKNIQVLKGENAGRVMVYMRLITKDLGVKCDFCHVPGAFDKDDKPHKATARQMMTMMGGIAKTFTHGEVVINCYTCHKGQPEPVSFPPQDATAKPEEKKPNQ
jgi:hypothetical protein